MFNIQTPVAIAIAVRYGTPNPNTPAQVHYCRIEGPRAAKLEKLESIEGFKNLQFEDCPTEWQAPFRPQSTATFFGWPQITDLMPWQQSGVKAGRTWVIGTTSEVLSKRAQRLFSISKAEKENLFKNSPTGKKISDKPYPIAETDEQSPLPQLMSYGYRSFDRQFVVHDFRFIDRPSPPLWHSHSNVQIYFASLLSSTLGAGPALSISADVPDLHYFCGRGAKDTIPLYRDAQAQHPNVHPALLAALKQALGKMVSAEDIAAYLYAVLAHPGYTARFHGELENREVRVPLTLDRELFESAVAIGRRLLYLHSYGERFAHGQTWPPGHARCTKAIPTESLPEKFSYDEASQALHVDDGLFKPVAPAVWEFEVSGLKVVQSWLGYRMKNRKGKKSSPLDDITPGSWPPEFTSELLHLLHLLEETLELYPQQAALLERIIKGPLLNAAQLGTPPDEYRKPPADHGMQGSLDFDEQVNAAHQIMKARRNVLRELAK